MELDQIHIPTKSEPRSEPNRAFSSRTDRLTQIIHDLETLSALANTQPGQQHIEQAIGHLVDAKLVEGMVRIFGDAVPDTQVI